MFYRTLIMLFCVVLISFSSNVFSGSQEEAESLCAKATKRMLAEFGAPASVDVSRLCADTPYSDAMWRCALSDLESGSTYGQATSSCGMAANSTANY